MAQQTNAFVSPKIGRQHASMSTALFSSSLSSSEAHALEVFQKYTNEDSTINSSENLYDILCSLDVEATEEEADVLFRYLDGDADGNIDFEDFLPWYQEAANAARAVAESFQSLLVGRRTIEDFDHTPVDKDILQRAVQCAIAAPNRSMSEPWRFISIGPETVGKFAELNKRIRKNMETDEGASSVFDWTQVPGWCVVTTKLSPDDKAAEQEDFKSVSCAIQNFMLSMWSEGVGTKWTSGPVQKTQEFADLCGVDTSTERVVGCIWYGYAAGGAKYADPRRRKKEVQDVLSHLP
jgi:nitroreductase